MTGSRRVAARTQQCTADEAAKRLRDARAFLEVAELTSEEAGVSAANAVLAGIAAADAACCRAHGERSRGQDHRDAVKLVEQVRPGGREAAAALNRLLALKNNDAQYGLAPMSAANRDIAVRQARKLIDFAAEALDR